MARVALLTANPLTVTGGVERFCYYLVQAFHSAGHEVDVYDRTRTQDLGPSFMDKFGLRDARLARAIAGAFQKAHRVQPYDLVLANGMMGWSVSGVRGMTVYHGTYAGYTRGVSDALNWRDKFRQGKVKGFFERQSGIGKHVIAVSQSTANEVRRHYGLAVGSVIPNAVDLSHFRPLRREQARATLGLPQDEVLLLFTGRMEYRKGFDVLANLAQTLGDGVRLVVATDVAAGDCPIQNATVLTNVSYQALPALYSACDGFLFPTRYEGCSYSLIEAMACGCPPITTRVGQAVDIAEADRVLAEAVVEPEDWAAMGRVVTRLCQDSGWRQELAHRSRNYAKAVHDVANWQATFVSLARELLDTRIG